MPSPRHPLTSAFTKLGRADAHLKALQSDIQSFIDSDPYRTVVEPHREGRLGATARVVVEINSEPPALAWGVIVGDIVHNLRSALDNLVWELTLLHSGPPPAPEPFKWRAIQFPVAKTGGAWAAEAKSRLWGIDPRFWARFERLQPFHRGQQYPGHWLWMLQELSNRDKHRTLHLVATQVALSGARMPSNLSEQFDARLVESRSFWPIEDGTEVGKVVISRIDAEGPSSIPIPMNVDCRLAFNIAFDQGPPGYGAGVVETLQRLYDGVAAVLIDFEPEFT